MAIQRIAEALTTGGSFEVYGSGEQSRDVTYVEDAVSATITIMEGDTSGAYNIGGGSETTLREIISLCEEITRRSSSTSASAPSPPATSSARPPTAPASRATRAGTRGSASRRASRASWPGP